MPLAIGLSRPTPETYSSMRETNLDEKGVSQHSRPSLGRVASSIPAALFRYWSWLALPNKDQSGVVLSAEL